jgi:excisionase family DNA binding protein
MQAIQITNISADEFQRMIQQIAETAARQAVEGFMKVKEDPNEEVTTAHIASVWKCSKQTVFRRIKEHKVPYVKLGREVAIKRRYLEQIKKPIPKD